MSHKHSVSLVYGSWVHCGWKIGTSTEAWDWADRTCKSDLERVLEHYTQDRDAGYEEPWPSLSAMSKYIAEQHDPALTALAKALVEAYGNYSTWDGLGDVGRACVYRQARAAMEMWGAERALYSRQLQDANKRIHELEAELLKMREDMRKLMHAAAHPPQIEEEPVAFPARALRFSI